MGPRLQLWSGGLGSGASLASRLRCLGPPFLGLESSAPTHPRANSVRAGFGTNRSWEPSLFLDALGAHAASRWSPSPRCHRSWDLCSLSVPPLLGAPWDLGPCSWVPRHPPPQRGPRGPVVASSRLHVGGPTPCRAAIRAPAPAPPAALEGTRGPEAHPRLLDGPGRPSRPPALQTLIRAPRTLPRSPPAAPAPRSAHLDPPPSEPVPNQPQCFT